MIIRKLPRAVERKTIFVARTRKTKFVITVVPEFRRLQTPTAASMQTKTVSESR